MKRIFFAAATVAAVAATLVGAAAPVFADGADPSNQAGLVESAEKVVERTINPILDGVPTPPAWKERHVCAWNDTIDQSWCVYFPFPI